MTKQLNKNNEMAIVFFVFFAICLLVATILNYTVEGRYNIDSLIDAGVREEFADAIHIEKLNRTDDTSFYVIGYPCVETSPQPCIDWHLITAHANDVSLSWENGFMGELVMNHFSSIAIIKKEL